MSAVNSVVVGDFRVKELAEKIDTKAATTADSMNKIKRRRKNEGIAIIQKRGFLRRGFNFSSLKVRTLLRKSFIFPA